MAEFGKKRQPIQFTQSDLKQAIVNANKSLKNKNTVLEATLSNANQRLKDINNSVKAAEKELHNLNYQIKHLRYLINLISKKAF